MVTHFADNYEELTGKSRDEELSPADAVEAPKPVTKVVKADSENVETKAE